MTRYKPHRVGRTFAGLSSGFRLADLLGAFLAVGYQGRPPRPPKSEQPEPDPTERDRLVRDSMMHLTRDYQELRDDAIAIDQTKYMTRSWTETM